MSALTRLQLYDLVKASLDDKDKIEPLVFNQFAIHSCRRVQLDMMNLGIKTFTKTTILEGGIVDCPSDLVSLQNGIIDVRASTGTRGTEAWLSSGGQYFSISVREPGNTSDVLTLTNDAAYTTPAVTSYTLGTPSAVTVKYKSGTTTVADLNTLFTTNDIFKHLFVAVPSGSGAFTDIGGAVITFTGLGTGTGWKPAREYSVEDFNRLSSNSFTTPSSSFIAYKRVGDTGGTQQLVFNPLSVTYSEITYYYLLTEMSSDSSTSGLPPEFEELLVIDLTAKCYEKLRVKEMNPDKQGEYKAKAQELESSYQNLFAERIRDKQRLLTLKPQD